MCSIGDDEEFAAKFMEKIVLSKNKQCNKCKSTSIVILLRSKDFYCKECFINSTLHKFKAFLGKLRISRIHQKILVSYKTGHSSSSLLKFLRNGLDAIPQKQLHFVPIVIYIERNYHLPKKERIVILENVSHHIEDFGFTPYFVSFEEFLVSDKLRLVENYNELSVTEGFDENRILKETTKLTYRKEVLEIFERRILVGCAKLLDCSFIMSSELTADITVDLLTKVSLGRGNQLPLHIGVMDDRDPQVKIIKPMRHLNVKECAIFNYFNNIEPVMVPERKENHYSSVQGLIADFIHKLQADYPATVSTVLRTGDKLTIDYNNASKCSMCEGPIFPNVNKLTSSEAIRFSHHLSTTKLTTEIDPTSRYQGAIALYNDSNNTVPQFCYTCEMLSGYLIK